MIIQFLNAKNIMMRAGCLSRLQIKMLISRHIADQIHPIQKNTRDCAITVKIVKRAGIRQQRAACGIARNTDSRPGVLPDITLKGGIAVNDGEILKIIDKYQGTQGALLAILEEIQSRNGYLPESALRMVADKTNYSLVDVYGIVTFYHSFKLKPNGKNVITVCHGTACHVRGAKKVSDEFERRLDIRSGDTTEDGEFTLETVNCLGACALGPIVVANGNYLSNVAPSEVVRVIKKTAGGTDMKDAGGNGNYFPLDVACPHCHGSLLDPGNLIDGHASIKLATTFDGKRGWLRLSSLYGSYTSSSENAVPNDTVVTFLCPLCHKELPTHSTCIDCEAPVKSMDVRNNSAIQFCSRKGCKFHMLEINKSVIDLELDHVH